MTQAVTLGRGKSGTEDWISYEQALTLGYSGRLHQARIASERALVLAQRAGQRERAALWQAGTAVWEAFFGNAAAAKRSALAALELSKARDVEYGAAFALALSRDFSTSRKLAVDLAMRFPDDTSVRFSYLPTLNALFALNEGEPPKAIEKLQIAAPNELGVPGSSFFAFFGALYPAAMTPPPETHLESFFTAARVPMIVRRGWTRSGPDRVYPRGRRCTSVHRAVADAGTLSSKN
jgi:eukaryotic-like serine/threonine-protein kinase